METSFNTSWNGNEECAPIKTLSELWEVLRSPPDWTNYTIHKVARSNFVIKNEIGDCHVENHEFIPKIRLDGGITPKTLVCHDMKNGYLEDKYINPVNIGNGYTFYHWSQIDIFIYFSHHLITIPPLSWINVAHKNGVSILGTFITEWDKGKEVCKHILQDVKKMEEFADGLINICILFKLDGWFINIENIIEQPKYLREFLHYLTSRLHERKAGSYVIWYDSVTKDGDLKWQNELNDLNKCYFDVCDGIFLNYCWKEYNLKNTVEAGQHRILDIYVGVDVFGRGSFGGGQFNTYLAAKAVREYGLSLALFAQGWTHESLKSDPQDTFLERFYEKDSKFWDSLWPYFYTHTLKSPFQTFFHIGVDKEWYTLGKQDIHPTKILVSGETFLENSSVSILSRTCCCLQLQIEDNFTYCRITNEQLNKELYIHHLFSCDIKMNGNFIIFIYDSDVHNTDYQIILLIQNKKQQIKKVICNSNERHIDGNDSTVIELNPLKNHNHLNIVHPNIAARNWRLKCFNVYGDHVTILEIGINILNGKSVSICGFGIRNYNN